SETIVRDTRVLNWKGGHWRSPPLGELATDRRLAQVGEQEGGHRGPVSRRMFGGERHRPVEVGAHDQPPAALAVPQHNLFRGAVVLSDFVDSVDTPPGGGEAPASGKGQLGYRRGSHLRSPFVGVWRPGARPRAVFVCRPPLPGWVMPPDP